MKSINGQENNYELNTESRIVLQKAGYDDVGVLAGFLHELFLLEQDFKPDIDKQTFALALAIDSPDLVSIFKVVLRNGDELIGMVALHKSISTAEGGWAGRIEDLYLRPGYRGKGMGAEVIDEIVRIAKADGLCRVTLIADKNNEPALNFYKKHGFEEMNLVSFAMRL
ncbi:MAG: GNAT family N-acetyltransferase [Rubrobacteridae bacterium]|nr:GNAT family N-acetyltransferase [Rubrobacteridae bacterium]